MFNFGTKRDWIITKNITGKWNHFFRAQGERLYYRLFKRSIPSLKEAINVVSTDTLAEYVSEPMRAYEEELLAEKEE